MSFAEFYHELDLMVRNSLLAPDRKEYWLAQLADPSSAKRDLKTLFDEVDAAIDEEQAKVAELDSAIATSEEELRRVEAEQLSYLQGAYSGLVGEMDAEVRGFKADVDEIDRQTFIILEQNRAGVEKSMVEELRKKLLGDE